MTTREHWRNPFGVVPKRDFKAVMYDPHDDKAYVVHYRWYEHLGYGDWVDSDGEYLGLFVTGMVWCEL